MNYRHFKILKLPSKTPIRTDINVINKILQQEPSEQFISEVNKTRERQSQEPGQYDPTGDKHLRPLQDSPPGTAVVNN
jgi:hypothetical protein